jgi:hypothetical protein
MIQRCWGYTYEQGESRVRVGEERGGKEIDGCPLTGNWKCNVRMGACSSIHE